MGEGAFVLTLPRCHRRAGEEDDGVGRGEVVRTGDLLGDWIRSLAVAKSPRCAATAAWAASAQACQKGWSVSAHSRPPSSAADTAVDQRPRRSADHDSRTSAVPDLAEFPDRGHSLTIDSGWRAVADDCLSWLAKQGL